MSQITKTDIRARLGLRPIINVSGTMTALGASIAVPEAIRAAAEILPEWVEINDLHRKASKVIAVGNVTDARAYQLSAKITERTAAALYVVSHHVVHYGQIPLDVFAAACHAKGVPVIADLASESDLKGFLAAGADIAVYSAHK